MLHKIKFQIMFIMRHYNGEQKKTNKKTKKTPQKRSEPLYCRNL